MKTFFPYIIGLFVWVAFSHATNDVLQARADLVFPFKVGQQYQFKAARDFAGPLGPTLLANTVAEITITEVVFDTSTYLHVPYWASFGTGYYRLDESFRIWNYDPRNGTESVFLNLGTVPENKLDDFYAWNCTGGYCMDVMISGRTPGMDKPLHWGYADIIDGVAGALSGWATYEFDSVLVYVASICCPDPGLPSVFGSGTSRHYYGNSRRHVLWGHFRPASSLPWPTLSDEIVGMRRSTWGEIKSRFAPAR